MYIFLYKLFGTHKPVVSVIASSSDEAWTFLRSHGLKPGRFAKHTIRLEGGYIQRMGPYRA